MNEDPTNAELVDQWRDGDQDAAEKVYGRFADRLWHLAKTQIGQRLGRRVDADDIVQSVFRTFFRRTGEGQFSIHRSGSLWHLLVRITINKVRQKAEYHTAQKRDVRNEIYPDGDLSPNDLLAAPDDGSVETLIEELDEVITNICDTERHIVQLCLQGYSTTEIAHQISSSRWTIRRVLDRIGGQLERRL